MFESPASSNVSSQQLQQASQTQLRPPAGLVVTAPHQRSHGYAVSAQAEAGSQAHPFSAATWPEAIGFGMISLLIEKREELCHMLCLRALRTRQPLCRQWGQCEVLVLAMRIGRFKAPHEG